MRLLLMTHLFAPSIGGIETMSWSLAQAFASRGHEVRVVTATPARDGGEADRRAEAAGFRVVRGLGRIALLREVAWCEVCFHNNISLAFAWPVLALRRPWFVTSQTWIARNDGSLGWRERLKKLLLRAAGSIAISRAVAESLPVGSVVIPNCYDASVFRPEISLPAAERKELIFVGRLVSDKGADLVLQALELLAVRGLEPALTLVGDGPERAALEKSVREQGRGGQVVFAGSLQGEALARELGRHRIQLVPSRWAEPFGIVALEGAGCGCLVIGSCGGGLGDAIGPCGVTFPNGNAAALAARIEDALRGRLSLAEPAARRAHLHRHEVGAVADCYLRVFEDSLR